MTQTKILFINLEKCTGCKMCEFICSLHNEHVSNPTKARINITRFEKKGLYIPLVCLQCSTPVCERMCPTGAMYRDPKTNAIAVNYDRCYGCKICMIACPLGAIKLVGKGGEEKIVKCDLCKSDPLCVKFCSTEAIQYISPTKAIVSKQKAAITELKELYELMLRK